MFNQFHISKITFGQSEKVGKKIKKIKWKNKYVPSIIL